jgi:hypothetical protein
MTDDLQWETIRAQTIELFAGQTPRAEDETRIIPLWQRSPATYTTTAQNVAHALHAGTITWGWSALAARLERAHTPAARATAATGPDRERRIQRAEQWIHAAGIHYDRADEVWDELAHGLLKPYADDAHLEQHIRSLWADLRPIGEAVEQEAEDRAARYRQHHHHTTTTHAEGAAA